MMYAYGKFSRSIWILVVYFELGLFVNGDYCPPYVDKNNAERSGYNCPTAYKLVGKSDFYCCWSDINERQTCCNDRTKSLFHRDLSYGEEALTLNWPFILLGALLIGMVIVLPYTYPRVAEMKQDAPG